MLLLVLGLVSALYGILQASVASDLKRLLAYSTTENVGLMLLAVGAGAAAARRGPAGGRPTPRWRPALLLAVSHAAFKTVLFLGGRVGAARHR